MTQARKSAAPPSRDGVGPSCVALPAGPWPTIVDFLAQQFPAIARSEWIARALRGDVIDAQGAGVTPGTPYQPHRKIYYYRSLSAEARIPFEETVLYRDEYLIAVDKPHFLPVTPAGRYLQETLLVRLKRKLGIDTLAPLHRIDRETAGLVLFTVQPATRDRYHALFRDRMVAKTYEAIAPWNAALALTQPFSYSSRLVESASFMQMREEPGTPNAQTLITMLEARGALARYRLEPVTGQKHQLRAHMAALGAPIVNDRIYPVLQPELPADAPDYSRPLQLLAKTLAFTDPVTGRRHQLESRQSLSFSRMQIPATE